jgi:two-component system, chemotaxis family, sensor kinase CheA
MEDFRRQFTLETVETLESLKRNLEDGKDVSGSRKREVFRTLHTVKGTAQTFGFDEASRLAHELETLLSTDENSKNLLIEGFGLLIESLTETNFNIPKNFTEKLRAASPNITGTPDFSTDYSSRIPEKVLSQLSKQEKNTLQTAIRVGQHLACLEIGFESVNFADGLINFRERLNKSGEIIATFPSARFAGDGKIGFQFLLASPSEIRENFRETEADILWDITPANYPNDVRGVMRQAAQHGREVAAKLGKHVEIKTQTEETTLTATALKLVFEVLTHLVRNAVDHAIGIKGEIDINLKIVENGIILLVADDGRGIDSGAVKAAAIDKKLISGGENLSEQETVELIFLPEFSTKSGVTEISGRGVGLDAVKHAVEKHGGKINVATEKEKGTTFEIFLPR